MEPAKKSFDSQEADGFFYFNPNKDLDDSSFEEDLDITILKKNLIQHKRRFFASYLILMLINLMTMMYWITKIGEISSNEKRSQECDNANHCSSSVSFLIKTLIITQTLWLLNFVLGSLLLKWKFNFGVSIYFSTLILVFFARTTLNIFVIIANKKLNALLDNSFDIYGYLVVVLLQTLGDILLLVLTIKMRRSNQKVDNLEEERLMAGSLLKVKVYAPQIEKTTRAL